jgi:HEAT repeat protein
MGTIALVGEMPKDIIQSIILLLKDADAEARKSGARALGEIGSKAADAVPALQELKKDADPDVRKAAAFALSRIDPGSAAQEG